MRDSTDRALASIPLTQNGAGSAVIDVTADAMEKAYRSFMSSFSASSRITMKAALARAADDLGWEDHSDRLELMPWHTLTSDDLASLKSTWEDQIVESTISLYMHALRGMARACLTHRLMSSDQYVLLRTVRVPRAKNEVGRGRAIVDKYRLALMKNCMDDERIQGVRDAALIALLFGSGIRRAEAASLADEKIDTEEGEIQVVAKGKKRVVRYLAAWAIPYVCAWRDVRQANNFHKGDFFNRIYKGGRLCEKGLTGRGIYKILEQRSIKANLPFLVKPHDARRTLATQMIEEHGELVAQKVLGHSSLSTTKIYDKRADNVIKTIFKTKTQ